MARTFRSQSDGAIYHLIVRGNNRQPLFRENKDRERYLELLHRYRDLFGYRLYAYILLTNHLQLLLETPRGNVSKVMQCLGTNYASYFNRKYKRRGTLFEGRYKSHLVDGGSNLSEHTRFIHRYCFHKGLKGGGSDYPWSSYRIYIGWGGSDFVETGIVLSQFGQGLSEQKREYREFVENGDSGRDHLADAVNFHSVAFKADSVPRKIYQPGDTRFQEEASIRKAEEIIQKVRLSVESKGVEGLRERRREALIRHLAMYLIRKETPLPLHLIGKLLGVKSAAVAIAVGKVGGLIKRGGFPRYIEDLMKSSDLLGIVSRTGSSAL